MHKTDALAEGDRVMTVCNSCRYCEGLCAVFPAMEKRRVFADGDLDYLASLCHNCGACFYSCQFAPPHEFNVNVPLVLANIRSESYARNTWPGLFSPFFTHNALVVSLVTLVSVIGLIAGFVVAGGHAFLRSHIGRGAFYVIMSHDAMVIVFGIAFIAALAALAAASAKFWRSISEPAATLASPSLLAAATRDAATLRYLEGGGPGCMNQDERPTDRRRLFHHLTFWGFLFCFAATCVGTIYHYGFGREAPYPWWDIPVVLGTLGGFGLIVGTAGLLVARFRRDPPLADAAHSGAATAFIVMLFLTALSGLAVLFFRTTPALNPLLALHLGIVLGLFLTFPYGKFVHGFYRFAALLRYARESRASRAAS